MTDVSPWLMGAENHLTWSQGARRSVKGGDRAVRARNNKPQQSFTRTGQDGAGMGWDGQERRGEDMQALQGHEDDLEDGTVACVKVALLYKVRGSAHWESQVTKMRGFLQYKAVQ